MGKWCLHASSFIFYRTIIKVAGNQVRHKSLVEFDYGQNQTTHFGITCPWVTKILHFRTWISLKPVGQCWSNFVCSIIGVGEKLHKVFGQIRTLRWAIDALWATSFCLALAHIVCASSGDSDKTAYVLSTHFTWAYIRADRMKAPSGIKIMIIYLHFRNT